MELTSHEAVHHEDLLEHDWRVSRLVRLGIPASLAEVYASRIDWHQLARLVQRGCPRGWPSALSAERMSGPVSACAGR
jgi:hypothetical protein